jgi:hypothetical protein
MVAAEVPLLPKVMPLASVVKVKLTDATVVAVTAIVPVADVALAVCALIANAIASRANVVSLFLLVNVVSPQSIDRVF